MAAHARLSASGADRWARCPGSVKAEEGCADKGSDFAAEGTTAHALADYCLSNGVAAASCVGMTFEGRQVDAEMCDYVQQYVDYVCSFSGEHFYEVRVDFSPWVPEGFGTSDCIVIDAKNKLLRVIDLKYGKGVKVDADNNYQAQLYALGAINDMGFLLDVERVNIAIVQPRLDHISEWEITVAELMRFAEYIKERAQLACELSAERVPGEKQCQWCKAKATCPALYDLTQQNLMQSFDVIQIDTMPKVERLTDLQLKLALDSRKLIESWLSAVEQYATEQILDGKQLAGYKLVEGRSVRQWIDEKQAETELAERFDESEIYKKSFISVAQAEKLLGKKQAGLLDGLVTKPQGKPTLAPDSDKRAPIGANISDFDACAD